MKGRVLAVVAVAGMLAAACGGGGGSKSAGGSKNDAAGVTSSTASTVESSTTTEVSSTPTSVNGPGAVQTATTARSGTATKSTTKTTAKTVTQVTVAKELKGGISNVTAPPTTAPSKSITPGGSLTYITGADIATLDPVGLANSGNSDAPSAFMVFDMLAYADPLTGDVTPQTMESLTSTDAVVWTLKLHPNIKFSDGTPYDANAVKFNWQRLQDPKNAASRAAQANLLASMDVVDPVTLKLTLKAKNAVFPQAVALIPFIGSPAAIQSEGSAFGSQPVGAGPFILKSWVRDSGMTLSRNPNYWQSPKPYVDQVQTRLIGDISQRMNTFNTNGTPNLMYINTAPDADTETKSGGIPNAVVVNGGNVMYFNVRTAPFNDVRARQAITMAIDRADMIKTIDNGLIPPMDSLFRHESPFYDPNIVQLPYDPVKAQQIFDQLAAETGGPLKFTLYTFNVSVYPIAAQYIQGALNKYRNVNVSVDTAATATQIARVTPGNFTAALYGDNFLDPDPGWTGFFTCSANNQFTGWCDPKFDADVNDQRSTLDPKQRVADLKDAQKLFYDQVPGMFFERKTAWVFSNPPVQDLGFANDGMPLFDRLWIKK